MITPYWTDGEITLYHGSALDVLPLVSGHVLMTDPDYGVGVNFTKNRANTRDLSKNVPRQAVPSKLCDSLLVEMLRMANVERNGLLFWSGSWNRVDAFRRAVRRAGWRIHHLGIWYKPNGAGPSGNGLARRFEPWFWIERGKAHRVGEWNFLPDCIDVSRIVPGHGEAINHPTQKPIELMRRLVRFFTLPGETIIDPFAGSGTTLMAARELGRKAIGIELSEEFCELIVQRLTVGNAGVRAMAQGQGALL